jgi:hypothetical protein
MRVSKVMATPDLPIGRGFRKKYAGDGYYVTPITALTGM